MTATLIDGGKIAESLKHDVAIAVDDLSGDGLTCGLATVMVGDDYSSRAYVRRLSRLAAELRVPHKPIVLAADSSTQAVCDVVHALNEDDGISGILLLRPFPRHIDEADVFTALSPVKDIEAVHPENAGLLALGRPRYVPSTAASVFHLLDRWLDECGTDRPEFYHHALIVVVGRSNNVGKPLVSLAYDRQAAVESVDEWASRTGRLGRHTRRADVLVVAAGVPRLIQAEHVRAGAIVLDVGINPWTDPATGRVRMVGDVDTLDVMERARAVTPVPGGVGPVTDVWLLHNIVLAARNRARAALPL